MMGRVVLLALLAGLASPAFAQKAELPPAAREVWAAETAFAKTMADRDHAAFATFVSEEGVFMSETQTLRGRAQVAEGWRPFYQGSQAPFSWTPERVEVLDSGTLALSTGPVFDPQGKRVGTFISTWRREADGKWRVVFDKGCPPCGGQD